MDDSIVVAVDPGREKCGLAVVHKQTGVIEKKIVLTANLLTEVEKLAGFYNTLAVVLGDRTTSKSARAALSRVNIGDRFLNIIMVDEHRSTEEARRLYWQENPPRGLKAFIPTTMQVPPAPVDDYVAVTLARRYFAKL
ncbi:MAG TPA: pre-16S rRNA-processing nuclease YqgF [Methylomusa anaerophila]|uniref:YqgF/RNase H-like domain-containing protein n=1 Tax=Methylomusa anaerophila TaxID=1930071 RepID=A0A348AKI6_9FIRM|nr:pre-16S rRNA-processing nuclease YqgF [Methylomusa anaerophila]BBB91584.1 hypothetical protein MAMMFC1_02268 [Methylomusa anaerophila]HML89478.1 pre-16S rRNA-processing nuclease YqgF [Methylomusa anaerophila]